MRLRMALAALLTMVASLGLVGSANAAPTEPTYSPTATGAQSFLVVRKSGELVRWDKASGTYQPQQIGTGWGLDNTKLIASLSTTQLVEIRQNGYLWDWKYTAAAGWTGYQVGPGWGSVTSIAGLATDRFVALTGSTGYQEWYSPASNHSYQVVGSYSFPVNQKVISGLSLTSFVAIDTSNFARRYVWNGSGYTANSIGPDWGNVEQIAGVNANRFVTVRNINNDYRLVEWNLANGAWTSNVYGPGWDDARLLG
ncbi:hypothetical protein [Actinokineospora cianjurensis]|uniref:Fucose-binding lectin n=1 Tax=Actinokineospora cianjurensis TaxID=585224 RepID=A0A421B1I2_9PSEU|nr:hypothetical protein [Actinokineospora cianjurensis]RLK58217.1 hypothetical protein CLV68_4311 [Actinokineospora cianjurensis]